MPVSVPASRIRMNAGCAMRSARRFSSRRALGTQPVAWIFASAAAPVFVSRASWSTPPSPQLHATREPTSQRPARREPSKPEPLMETTLLRPLGLVEREAARGLRGRVALIARERGEVVADARDVDVDAAHLEPRRGAHGVGDPLPEERRELGDVDAHADDERQHDADLALAEVDAHAAHADADAEEAEDPLPDREAAELDDARRLARLLVDDGRQDLPGDGELALLHRDPHVALIREHHGENRNIID